MGNYAVAADVTDRFESDAALAYLTDTADTTGASDTTRVNEGIKHGEGFINSYLATMYEVPVDVSADTALAAFLKNMTIDLVIYHLVRRPGAEIPDQVQRLYDNVVAWLKDFADGDAVLPATATPASTGTRAPLADWGTGSSETASKRNFTFAQQEAL